ncbi:MAG: sterol desaturase family protein [Deltaproteobacteria bacterium]|jgi:sterol desaturase/sphingolipid hydroxylase (fatty acid hydroxylase superfamily)|nr:sterol desaturase family protein [Deltaproteobacteria bacterium]MBT6434259.1 sterol desaturase family protein [Deltaproteobacteria bacterium]MBT6491145.1 sterol desaturase family protein [Deltaproteobacteria bacterium]
MLDAGLETFRELVNAGNTYMFLIPIYTTLLLGERITHAFFDHSRKWDNQDMAANLTITAMSFAVNTLAGHLLPLAAIAFIYQYGHVFELPGGTIGWVLGVLMYDLAWYCDHRIAHRVGFFWAMHHVHHSSSEYNMTVASRGFVVDTTLLSRPTFYLLPLLGLSPYHFIVINIFTNVWGIAQHTRLIGKLPLLDLIFATPSNHRVHHGSNEKYLDMNYGEVLIIWDRLFGTYRAEDQEPDYGVTDPINTCNPIKIQVAGVAWLAKKIKSTSAFSEKLRCLVMPPEWLPPALPPKPSVTP